MQASAIIDRHYNTLSVLKSGDANEFRNVITNYDSLLKKVEHMILVKSVYVQLEKAEEYHNKNNQIGEKEFLLLALKEMNLKKITDRDIETAGLQDYLSDTILSTKKIETRLNEL
ncbi:hypothetical protein BH23BAC3_BH23BAC3_19690 [soil metagenome]